MRRRVARTLSYRGKVAFYSLIDLPFLVKDITDVALRPCMEETVSRCNSVFPERFRRPALFCIGNSKIEMGLSEIRIKSESCQVFRDSLVIPALFKISHSKAGMAPCFSRAFLYYIVPQEKRFFPYAVSHIGCKCNKDNQYEKKNVMNKRERARYCMNSLLMVICLHKFINSFPVRAKIISLLRQIPGCSKASAKPQQIKIRPIEHRADTILAEPSHLYFSTYCAVKFAHVEALPVPKSTVGVPAAGRSAAKRE